MQAHKVIESLNLMANNQFHKEICDLLIRKITESIKFEFDFGEFPVYSREGMQNLLGDLKLPFPLCYFEIPNLGSVLARESIDDRYIMIQVFCRSDSNIWGVLEPEFMLAIDKKIKNFVTLSKDIRIQKEVLDFENYEDSYHCSSIISFVIRGISVLNCSNVETVENEPPKALNKKRMKYGKVPLFSYRTLHISTGKTKTINSAPSSITRCGPRLHLRRGHIRRLGSGETVWVKSCVVGDKSKGVALKDYHVTN